ncbi:MAG: hypothetical protein ABFS56_30225, partial [Pseudomonadota bacterium]
RDAQIFRGALLSHASKPKEDIPYPHILENVLSQLEKERFISPPWYKKWYSELKKLICGKPEINYCPVGWAFATVFVLMVGLTLTCQLSGLCSSPESPVDTAYQTVYASQTAQTEEKLRELKFRWERDGGNVQAFGPNAQASEAAKAFGAGLLTGREALLGQVAQPLEESWLKTQWKNDFELGRWTILLWTASHHELPETFWDEQREIFSQLKAAFVARAETKKVLFQLEKKIEPHLEKLPADGQKDLRFNLKKMMDFLAPEKLQ